MMNKISKFHIVRPSVGSTRTATGVGGSMSLVEVGVHTVHFGGMIVTLRLFKKTSLIFRDVYLGFLLNNFGNRKTKKR